MPNLETTRIRWQDVVNLLLGAWLSISPWVLGFNTAGIVATNAWVFGVIIAGLALSAILAYQEWEEWLQAAIGIWIFVSPWVLKAAGNPRILWSSLIVGALLVVLALWSSSLERGSGAMTTSS
jgi:hypothetical protein